MYGWSDRARRRGRALGWRVGLGAMLAAAWPLASCRQPEVATAGQVLRLSQRNEPSDLDPARATLPDDFAILRALYEGLLIPGPQGGEPIAGAAARFEVSPDGLVYTFHLRPDGGWSDGAALTAQHFVAAYRRTLDPATAAPKATAFYAVRGARRFVGGEEPNFDAVGIRAVDARTLAITLAEPNPRFPYYVASGPWLPVRADLAARHGRAWTRPEHFVGNGPFVLSEWRADRRIVVRKNQRWHGAANVRLSEIHFMRFDSGDTEERAFRAGQVDATMSVPFSKVEVYARDRSAELHRAPMIETRYLSFNTRRPPLDDERVRLALAFAIDRQSLVARVLKGGQPPAGRLVPPLLRAGAEAPLPMEHRHDPARAKELWSQAGGRAATARRLEVTVWSPSQVPVLEAVQAMWRRELGLNVGIAVREAKVHLDSLAAGDYDIAFITAIPDVADAAEILGDLVTGGRENYPQWRHAGFDRSLAAARAIAEPRQRSAQVAEAEAQLLMAAPLTPLYFNPKLWLMSPRVRGWQEDGLWSRCYHTVYLDEK